MAHLGLSRTSYHLNFPIKGSISLTYKPLLLILHSHGSRFFIGEAPAPGVGIADTSGQDRLFFKGGSTC